MVKIGDLEIKVPIIQGGMAIRVSMAKLAVLRITVIIHDYSKAIA